MGAPESAQNAKCGPIQTQHDLPHLLYKTPICGFLVVLQGFPFTGVQLFR